MANRSNRRWQNPRVTECEKHETAMGSWRADSPSRSRAYRRETKAGYTCAVDPHRQKQSACKRGGVHTRSLRLHLGEGRSRKLVGLAGTVCNDRRAAWSAHVKAQLSEKGARTGSSDPDHAAVWRTHLDGDFALFQKKDIAGVVTLRDEFVSLGERDLREVGEKIQNSSIVPEKIGEIL